MALYQNIILALDFSPEAQTVALRAAELAAQTGGSLTLLHVVEPIPPGFAEEGLVPLDPALDEEVIRSAEQQLGAMNQRLSLGAVEVLVALGSPKHEIVRLAKERNADVIVIGSHGRHGWQLLLGSTANGVLHLAQCDVLAVRVQERD